jgi:demethoxyubiquinone hydroxylase (CLK1/Coq7/Cat5 family)
MSTERRKQTPWQIVTQTIMPILIAAFMMWVGSEVVGLKISFVRIEEVVNTVKDNLEAHNQTTKDDTINNALRHHRDPELRCTGCHIKRQENN